MAVVEKNPGTPPTPPHEVERDSTCRACGYNLRGLDPAGRCPECGAPIERSLQPNLLRYSSPQYLRRVHLGIRLTYLGMLSFLGIAGVTLTANMNSVHFGLGSDLAELLFGLLCAGAASAMPIGWYMLGTGEPSRAGGALQERNARRLRLCAIAALLMLWLAVLVSVVGRPAWLGMRWSSAAETIALGASLLTVLLFSVRQCRLLADRMESRRPASHVETARQLCLAMVGAIVIAWSLDVVAPLLRFIASTVEFLVSCAGMASVVCVLSFGASYLPMLRSISRGLGMEHLVAIALAQEDRTGQ